MDLFFETRTQTFEMGKFDILKTKVKKDIHMHLEDAIENIAVMKAHLNGGKCKLLLDISNLKSISAESRKYYGGTETTQIQHALAIITTSKFSKILGNFFMTFNRPKYPTKLFVDESMAIEWLKTI